MTMCPSFHRVDMDPHAYAGEPPTMTAIRLDVSEAQAYLARAVDYADSHCIEDHAAAAESLRDLATWANEVAQSIEDSVKEAER